MARFRFPPLFWAVLITGVVLSVLLRALLDYRQGRTANIILAVVVGSILFWIKGRTLQSRD